MSVPSYGSYPDLAGKVAVVTGASQGIGAEVCRALARDNARVVLCARQAGPLFELVEELTADGAQAIGIVADATSREALEELRHAATLAFGPPQLLVAFAGGFASKTPFAEISTDEFNAVIEANLTSTFLTMQTFLPGMIEAGGGSIVTMASNAGRYLDIPLTASYAAAKAGVVMLTRHVAGEVGAHGVRVNCVAPATVRSPRVDRLVEAELQEEIAALSPLGRLGVPDDVAAATAFLLSDASSWITGATLDITGGRVML